MWIFTRYGFFSVVCARHGDGAHGQPIDPDRMMVRARTREHLEALKARFPAWLHACDVVALPRSDYGFRVFVDKLSWREILSALGEETDYDNFKSDVTRHQGRDGVPYQHALHQVWNVMQRLQK